MSRDAKDVDRRTFLGTTAAAAVAMFIKPALVHGTNANSAIRVGLLGCGGRGTEDAGNLVDTGGARVVALADLFQDQLDAAHAHFDQVQQAKGYPALDGKQLFAGPHAYEQIAASQDVDAIVIATPPYFHPQHLETVVAAGKHVYLEKPVAVDVPGAKRVIEIGKRAQGKLSLDVGFQIRDCPPFVELVRRIHEGALGDIICAEAYYLTGDIIVEQNIHVIDICNWVLQAHPLKATATGGRQGRPVDDGDCYGNYNVLFRYPNNVPVTFSSTQFAKGWWDVSERFFGTKGTAVSPYSGPLGIWGDVPWQAPLSLQSPGQPAVFSVTGNFTSNLESADAEKKKAFIESINSGRFHNQADKGAESALSCMMARTAAYTGHEVTWDELLKSTEVWDARLNLDRLR
jgi:predicted dehydrogenase